jgi:LemA protein
MSKGLKTILIFAAIFLLGGVWTCGKRNAFVSLREDAKAQWQQVESQYQRRSDLVPNIVATVKGEAEFERGVLEAVVSARARATQVTISPENLDEKSVEKFKAVQGELSGALSRLLAVAENYPDLKTNKGFGDLRVTLEGTENRIAVERMKYNEISREYNKALQLFPGNIIAGMFTFQSMPYFESEAGAEKAPKVEF